MQKPNVLVQGAKSQAVLMHGDCLERMKELPEGSVDMVFADLPYSYARKDGKTRKCTNNYWDLPVDLDNLWLELHRMGKAECAFLFTAIQPFVMRLMEANLKSFRYDLIWEKGRPGGFLNAKKCPLRSHEHLLLFSSKTGTYNPQMTEGGRKFKGQMAGGTSSIYGQKRRIIAQNSTGIIFPRSVLRFSGVNNRASFHPTQKPVALLEWLIRTYTNENDTVLDPTAGSGTTAVAALNTGRNAICIEKDPTYFDVMCKRVRESQVAPKQAELALG